MIIFFIISTLSGAKMLSIVHYDPFKKAKVLLKMHTTNMKSLNNTPKVLSISAILNNRVYINGKFYKEGDIIYGYKIIGIVNKYIKVKKNKKISIIPLIKSNYFDNISLKGSR